MTRTLPWVAFAGAVAVLAALPFLVTAGNDASIFLIVVPPLLLIFGGMRSASDRPYAIACLGLGLLMNVLLLILFLVARDVLEMKGVVATIVRMGIAEVPVAIAAGIIPAAHALRGRLSRTLGVAGGAVTVGGVLFGAFILRELLAFT